MTKRNKQKADQKRIRKANQAAITGYPKAKIIKELDHLAEAKSASDTAKSSLTSASLAIARHACIFVAKAQDQTTDLGTIVTSWRDNTAVLAMTLAVKGHKFAELTPATDKAEAKAKLIGSGNNVMSTAKGCVEFAIKLDDVPVKDSDKGLSYRDVQAHVQGLREAARRKANPDAAAMSDAIELCEMAWSDLSGLVYSKNDVGLIDDLTALIGETTDKAKDDFAKQAEVQAEADGKAEAEAIEAASEITGASVEAVEDMAAEA